MAENLLGGTVSARVRFAPLFVVVVLVATVLGVAKTAPAAAPDDAPGLLILSGKANAAKTSVRITTDSVEWLSERPTPTKGEMTTAELAKRWADYGFDARQPRASISGDDVEAQVRLTGRPDVDDSSITFPIVVADGDLSSGSLGRVSVFVEAQPPSLLYLQEAQSGTFEQTGEGESTLTLESVSPRTFYFSDRPDRVAGSLGTSDFARLETLFDPDDQPNAAIVLSDAQGTDEDVVVVTLANPRYDASTQTFTYDTTIVDEVTKGLAGWESDRDDSLPPSFGHVSLYIDSSDDTDCPGQVSWDNGTVVVTATDDSTRQPLPGVEVQLFGASGETDPDYSGTTDAEGKLTLSVIPTDAYVQDYFRTTMTIDGYVTLQENITVCPDQTVQVTADLDPA